MAEELIFNARVNTGDASGKVGKLGDEMKDTGDEAKKAGDKFQKALDAIKEKVDSGTLAQRGLTKAIKEYQTIALQAGETSPVGKQAIAEAGALKDRLGDLAATVNVLGHDGANMQAALQLGSTVTAGYGALQGIMALTGGQSEELTAALVKLEAVQVTLASIESIRAALEKESFLMQKAQVIWTNLQTAASQKLTIAQIAQNGVTAIMTAVTGAAATAMGVLNAIMLLNPVFLLIAAFAAIAVAFAIFGGSADHAAEDNEKLNESVERSNELLEIQNEKMVRTANNRLKQAQAEGASEQELFQKRLQILKSEETARQNNLKEIRRQAEARIKVLQQSIIEGDEETQKAAEDELKSLISKHRKLKAQDGQYYADRKAMVTEFYRQQRELAEKDAEATLNAQILQARGNFGKQQGLRKELAKQERDAALQDVNLTEGQKFLIRQQYEAKVSDLNKESNDRYKAAQDARSAKDKEAAQKRLDLERLITDLSIENIKDEWQRKFSALAVAQERERADLIAKYGNDTKLLAELKLKQANDLMALDAEQMKADQEKMDEAAKLKLEKENADRKAKLEGELIQMRADFEARQELQAELALLDRDQALQNKELTEGEKFKIQQEYEQKIAEIDAERVEREKNSDEAIIAARQGLGNALAGLAGQIAGIAKEGSALQKAAALTEIGINTAIGFVNGLRIAQQAAAATGPGAAVAFPIFFATQIGAVLAAANKARQILKAGGSVSAPSASAGASSAGSSANAGGSVGSNSSTGTAGLQDNSAGTNYVPVLVLDSLNKVNDQAKQAQAVATIGG